ncbi:hypothetical protein Kisp01_22320 [Kineosporia sp. NBRC 101677]|nr:hypothetical protein Kisp01_22320 [Kineosporia sp. NBRC 101677]
MLGALAGEDHGQTTGFATAALHQPGRGAALRQGGESGRQVGVVLAEEHGPVLEHRAGVDARPGQVGARGLGVDQEVAQTGGLGPQGRSGAARDQHRNRVWEVGLRFRDRLLTVGGLFQNQVGVGAADPERGDPGPARMAVLLPGHRLAEQLDVAVGPVDVLGRGIGVQGLRQLVVLQRQHHLDHTGHTRGQLGVAQVGLDRAEPQRAFPFLAVGGQQRVGLDGIAERGARTVRLHRVHIGRGESGCGQGPADHPLLRGPVRSGQTVRGTVLVDRGTLDHREHVVPVTAGVRKPFQQNQANALGPAGAVRLGPEGLAPAIRGQPALGVELAERGRGGHHADATGQGQGALPRAQRLGGQVDGDQRR